MKDSQLCEILIIFALFANVKTMYFRVNPTFGVYLAAPHPHLLLSPPPRSAPAVGQVVQLERWREAVFNFFAKVSLILII